jgi:hypothetical protein
MYFLTIEIFTNIEYSINTREKTIVGEKRWVIVQFKKMLIMTF